MPRLRTKSTVSPPPVTGWRERVKLPGLGIGPILAKIDSGANSAALHAERIEVDGDTVSFVVPINGRNHPCRLPVAGFRRVKSSSGHGETRIVVVAEVLIGNHRYSTNITLTDRTEMGYPMLLGRAFLRGRFLIDPSRSYLLTRKKRRTPAA